MKMLDMKSTQETDLDAMIVNLKRASLALASITERVAPMAGTSGYIKHVPLCDTHSRGTINP